MERQTVYLPQEIKRAVTLYQEAGHPINISGALQHALLDQFYRIEQARALLNQPPVFQRRWMDQLKGRIVDDR